MGKEKEYQLNVKIPFSMRIKLEEQVLERKKQGKNINLWGLVKEYLQKGIDAEKERKTSFNQFVE